MIRGSLGVQKMNKRLCNVAFFITSITICRMSWHAGTAQNACSGLWMLHYPGKTRPSTSDKKVVGGYNCD